MRYIEPDLVKIASGSCALGIPPCPEGAILAQPWPTGSVVDVKSFLLGRFAVTNAEYKAFIRDRGIGLPSHINLAGFDQDKQPVVGISWDDAMEYCEWLSTVSGRRYRLPLDAEWEYAARAGNHRHPFPWGEDISLDNAWFDEQPAPKPVGSFPANGFGLHDMIGNVWEWCTELFDDVVPGSKSKNVPTGKPPQINRILRGGSFLTKNRLNLYIAHRQDDPPDLRHHCIGFRIAADV